MADGKIRIAVIGATFGERAHVPAIKSLPEFELTAVGTAHQETAEAMAQRTGAPKAYGDYQKMMADPEIDAVTVCVRPALHYPISRAALEAGKHVYCEWPSGLGSEQVSELAALAKERNRVTMVGLQARRSPVVMWLHRLIEDGYIGEILNFGFTQFMSQYQRNPASERWWVAREEEGGTALTLAGGAVVDLLSFTAGEPAEVAAMVDVRLTPWHWADTGERVDVTAPDSVAAAVRLQNGAVGTITVSRVSWQGSGQRLEVYGSEGSLHLAAVPRKDGRGRRQAVLGGKAGQSLAEIPVPDDLYLTPELDREAGSYPITQAFRQFGRAIHEGGRAEPDMQTGVGVHRVLEAIQRSSDERRWLRVDEVK